MTKHISILSILVAVSLSVMSQPKSGQKNTTVTVTTVAGFRLPAQLGDLSFFDDQIHFVAGGMLLSSPTTGSVLPTPSVDTFLVTVDPELTYSVRDPFTGNIYYTKSDTKGHSQLFVYYEKKPGKYVSRRVKLPGLNSSVSHPVFSSDGRSMVFVSDSPLGFGGTDLWFTMRNGDEWLSPQNMGHMVNSAGDEIMPAIYGDYLVFASNGRSDSYGGHDLYATRLVALSQTDTVMMYPIGRSPVHSLQSPFCSADDDLGLVASSDLSSGWWLRRDADSGETLCRFDGRLECVAMRGIITSTLSGKVENACVVTAHTPRPGSPLHYDTVMALTDGSYTIFLRPGEEYELRFHADNHFVTCQQVVPVRSNEERLYAAAVRDVQLEAYALDSLIVTKKLFSSSVSSELSPAGRSFVDNLARFLLDNPTMHINIYSTYNLSSDPPFCSLLNGSRLRSLTEYLVSRGVDSKAITTYSSRPQTIKGSAQQSDDRDLSPVAQSSLTVGFSFFK